MIRFSLSHTVLVIAVFLISTKRSRHHGSDRHIEEIFYPHTIHRFHRGYTLAWCTFAARFRIHYVDLRQGRPLTKQFVLFFIAVDPGNIPNRMLGLTAPKIRRKRILVKNVHGTHLGSIALLFYIIIRYLNDKIKNGGNVLRKGRINVAMCLRALKDRWWKAK